MGRRLTGALRLMGAGVIAGAADDDPSAIGTYASAGARYGLAFLWIAPILLPMMVVVVYLSAKIGRVSGMGLFAAMRARWRPGILYPLMLAAVAGNVIEAAADLGGVGAALRLFVPLPGPVIVVGVAAAVLALQLLGSYALLRRVFQVLALALFAYVGAAILARPDPWQVVRHTLVPHVAFTSDYLAIVVACIGTSLSAYIYSWQSNQEVEDQIAEGKRSVAARRGASEAEMRHVRHHVFVGMLFSNVILYFVILCAGTTLHPAGRTSIDDAAQAAAALAPLAGPLAKLLFALGLVGVGMLAIPVMTTGAAYDLAQTLGKRSSLAARPREAPVFYGVIVVVTGLAVALNFLGLNPMRALVWSGIVQGFSVPLLLLTMLVMTNDRRMMGDHVNGRTVNILGWVTVAVVTGATLCLVATWFA